jgi:hypothetical protein
MSFVEPGDARVFFPVEKTSHMNPRRRDKLVYFRLSGEEFEEMLKARDAKGARSVSDLAREAVKAFIQDPTSQCDEEMKQLLTGLQTVAQELKHTVHQLASIVVARDVATPGAESK